MKQTPGTQPIYIVKSWGNHEQGSRCQYLNKTDIPTPIYLGLIRVRWRPSNKDRFISTERDRPYWRWHPLVENWITNTAMPFYAMIPSWKETDDGPSMGFPFAFCPMYYSKVFLFKTSPSSLRHVVLWWKWQLDYAGAQVRPNEHS